MGSQYRTQWSPEERKDLREKVALLNKEASERWDDPKWRKEMAQEVTETIYAGFEHENLLSILVDVENAPWDGRVFVKEVRGLKAFWIARGGYIEESTLRSDVMEITRDTVGFHVSEFEDKLRTNFSETQATLVELGAQRLDAEVNSRMFRTLKAAIPTTSAYYLGGTGVTLAQLNTAIREVKDSTYSGDATISIVGRATMTEQIIDEITTNNSFGAFLPGTNEDLVRRGVLGTYRGAQIVTLRNYKDDEDKAYFPANELYVVARDAGKFAFYGGLQSKEFEEQDNWYWHYLARRDFGGVIHHPERVRRIVDTTITP